MKRFVFAAILATSLILFGCSDDPDPDITRLQSDLDKKFESLQSEIETLKQDVNTLAAETKTLLSDGQIPPKERRDPEIIPENTRGLLPSGQPRGEPMVRDGGPPGVVLHEAVAAHRRHPGGGRHLPPHGRLLWTLRRLSHQPSVADVVNESPRMPSTRSVSYRSAASTRSVWSRSAASTRLVSSPSVGVLSPAWCSCRDARNQPVTLTCRRR